MNIQLKQQLKNTLITQIYGLMQEYDIPASSMEDALIGIIVDLKDLIMQDYIKENLDKIHKLEQQIQDLQNPKEDEEIKES